MVKVRKIQRREIFWVDYLSGCRDRRGGGPLLEGGWGGAQLRSQLTTQKLSPPSIFSTSMCVCTCVCCIPPSLIPLKTSQCHFKYILSCSWLASAELIQKVINLILTHIRTTLEEIDTRHKNHFCLLAFPPRKLQAWNRLRDVALCRQGKREKTKDLLIADNQGGPISTNCTTIGVFLSFFCGCLKKAS